MYLCQNCGAELTAGSPKCRYCGAAAAGAQVPAAVPQAPPPMQGMPYGAVPVDAKSKIVAGILGILLGCLGVHNFYLGYTSKGLTQLLVSVLSCGYLALFMGIWGLIEGIMILTGSIRTDARGVPLKD